MWNLPQIHQEKPKDANMLLVGLGNTGSQPVMPKNLPAYWQQCTRLEEE